MVMEFAFDQFNQLRHISEVSRGLACCCTCIECHAPVEAKKGPVLANHFSHLGGTRRTCAGPSGESQLHRFAKHVIEQDGGLMVPPAPGMPWLHPGNEPFWLGFEQVDVEKDLSIVIPDVLGLTASAASIAIEVFRCNPCDAGKVARFAQLNLPIVEIDLHSLPADRLDLSALHRAVIHDVTCKTWLWPPAGTDQYPVEIITAGAKAIVVKQLNKGAITIRVEPFDDAAVRLVTAVAKEAGGYWNRNYKSWVIPARFADSVRALLRLRAKGL